MQQDQAQRGGSAPEEPRSRGDALAPLLPELDAAVARLEQARPFAKRQHRGAVLALSRRLLSLDGGLDALLALAPRLDAAGIFAGTDWDRPRTLRANLVRATQERADPSTVLLDCLSHLRLLAIALERSTHPGISAESARHFLTQVLALNLDRLFGPGGEATRARLGPLGDGVNRLYGFLLEHVGFDDILGSLIEEIWRILAQRPIQVGPVKGMIAQIAAAMAGGGDVGEARLGADRLVSALFGPTKGCIDDPGLEIYRERLDAMDVPALQQEAYGFARAMHDVGLVSDYHAVFLRWLLSGDRTQLVPDALGLSSTGLDVLRSYQGLVHRLIEEAVHPGTAQCVYGLALFLERGVLYAPPIGPALWRQIALVPSADVKATLATTFGDALPPRVHLLAGVISLLGQPLGVGQGNNPTCQSARAISMWAYNDPDFLLHLIVQAARHDGILMHFEGRPIASAELSAGLADAAPLDTDAVSVVLVPHLDRVYQEMGRICADRGEDPHRWINPEFHGWWVGRDFLIAVDVATGALTDHEGFLRRLYASYHPYYNGNQPVIHPQPAGVAVTDSAARFVGWHAITLLRVALDQDGVMRVYFFNPNNDSGQDWGNAVVVSTHGHGERYGESSLPFEQLASRLYIFHDDPVGEPGDASAAPTGELAAVHEMALTSWAADRRPRAATPTTDG